jgi:predicted phage-related endonuclease
MRIYNQWEQGTAQWLAVRAGIITASEASVLFTPKWQISESKGADSYLAQKLSEKWLGASPANSFMSRQMEDGHLREDEGRKAYQFQYDVEVSRVAFIASNDLTVGCSPDGLVGSDMGLELKCPSAETHVKYLLANRVPEEYVTQVYFSMFVTGFQRWVFVSHRPAFPLFVKVVERDEKIMETIEDGVHDFLRKLETAYKCLVHLNGDREPGLNSFREECLKQEGDPAPVQQTQAQQPETSDVPIP